MSCVMPLAAALWVECLVVISAETFLLEVVVVAGCRVRCLDVCYECVEVDVRLDDIIYSIFLFVLFQGTAPATELLAVCYSYLLFHTFLEGCNLGILLYALCAELGGAIYIIIGEGEVWLETYSQFVGYLVAIGFYYDSDNGLLCSTLASGGVGGTLDGSVVCYEIGEWIAL